MIKILVCIVTALAIQASDASSATTANVCSSNVASLISLSLDDFVSSLQDSVNKCPAEYQNSVQDLLKILSNKTLLKDVCSDDVYQAIKSYHVKYIKTTREIPESLRNYFISFTSDIAVLCARQMIDRFNKELKTYSFQLRELDEFKEARTIALKHLQIDGERPVPSHISELKIHEHNPSVHLILGTGEKSALSRVLFGCQVRYNVAGKELFAPVARLNNLGYGVGMLTMQETMSLLSHQYNPWMSAVDLCETLKDLDIIVDPRKKGISSVTDDEASKLKAELEGLSYHENNDFDSVMPLELSHQPVVYRQLSNKAIIQDVVSKFETENQRLSGNGKPSLSSAFDEYEQLVEFTTEKPQGTFGKIMTNLGF